MNEKHTKRDGVPEDYPGRVVFFPPEATHLVLQVIGIEGGSEAEREGFHQAITELAQLDDGPARVERGDYTDTDGQAATLLMLYWTTLASADAWWRSTVVDDWWRARPLSGSVGYYAERMAMQPERFNYAAGTEDRHGSAAVLPLEGSATFGYWGAYRDRLPASAHDDFASPLKDTPPRERKSTRGRRLRVTPPDNLCFIREGQGWGNCAPEEKRIWDEQMNDVVGEWVAHLGRDPAATGCLSIRDCSERDGASGTDVSRRTQIAFLLSLAHIEQAARTNPAHLAVHRAFVGMYTKPRFTPQMHVWVEVGIMRADEVMAEYVNCAPVCGLLPYFAATEVSA